MGFGYFGNWYTWGRGNFSDNNIRERLDIAVANEEFSQMFSNYLVHNLPYPHFDHCPILINLEKGNYQNFKHFKFEAW